MARSLDAAGVSTPAASYVSPRGAVSTVRRARNAHDLDRLRTIVPAGFHLYDHRRTGVGRLDGAGAYLASLAALWELGPDVRIDTLCFLGVAAVHIAVDELLDTMRAAANPRRNVSALVSRPGRPFES